MSTSSPRRSAARDGLVIVGLVGGTGSGKSTVAQMLAESGAAVIEGDALGHQVTDHDPAVRAALAADYGSAIYQSDGSLDRRKVAARVFQDPQARARLDQLVHPRIIERIRARLDELRARGFRGLVLIDAALLLDWGLESWCDALVAVVAPAAEQIDRLIRSRGWTREEAQLRLAAQRSGEAYVAAADEVLDNRGSRSELERAARALMARLLERHQARVGTTGKEPC